MTAEELARRANVTNDNYGGSLMVGTYLFETENEFQAFCDQLCAEQRESCFQVYDTLIDTRRSATDLEGIGSRTRNVPQPKTGG